MKIAAISPVLNEVEWIGYSIMAALPGIDSMHYGIDEKSSDGTLDLVRSLSEGEGKGRVFYYQAPEFNIDPMVEAQYAGSYNGLIERALQTKPDAIMFLHPDMIILNPEQMFHLENDFIAWFTHITSYSDFDTVITRGRATEWKNIHCARFGLHYAGAYGSQNEDFYHREITGSARKHYGSDFSKYPYQVADSGLLINHYCELKPYARRLEKMKFCLRTLYPSYSDEKIHELAVQHPRVSLESSSDQFGQFEFSALTKPIPPVLARYKSRFDAFKNKEVLNAY